MNTQLKRLDPEESDDIPHDDGEQASQVEDQEHATPDGTTVKVGGRQAPLIPKDVTTPHSKLVYFYLSSRKGANIDHLSKATRTPQIRLYPVLKVLVNQGHIDKDGSRYSISHGN